MTGDKRKVILGCGMSLDGYIARLDHTFDFLDIGHDPKVFEQEMADFMKTIDVMVMGRKTAEVMAGMDPAGKIGMPGVQTFVFSRSWPQGDGYTVVKQPPKALINKVRKHPGKHILLSGGGQLAQAFLKADLIDEMWLGVVPVLVGEGIPLFPAGFPQREFKLIKCERFGKEQLSLVYRRERTT